MMKKSIIYHSFLIYFILANTVSYSNLYLLNQKNKFYNFLTFETSLFPDYGVGAGFSFSSLTGRNVTGNSLTRNFYPRYAFGGEVTCQYFPDTEFELIGIKTGLWLIPSIKFPISVKLNYEYYSGIASKVNTLQPCVGYVFRIRKFHPYHDFGDNYTLAIEAIYGYRLSNLDGNSLNKHQFSLRFFLFANHRRNKPNLNMR